MGRIIPDVAGDPAAIPQARTENAWFLRHRIKEDTHFRGWVARTGMGARSYDFFHSMTRRKPRPTYQLSLAL